MIIFILQSLEILIHLHDCCAAHGPTYNSLIFFHVDISLSLRNIFEEKLWNISKENLRNFPFLLLCILLYVCEL